MRVAPSPPGDPDRRRRRHGLIPTLRSASSRSFAAHPHARGEPDLCRVFGVPPRRAPSRAGRVGDRRNYAIDSPICALALMDTFWRHYPACFWPSVLPCTREPCAEVVSGDVAALMRRRRPLAALRGARGAPIDAGAGLAGALWRRFSGRWASGAAPAGGGRPVRTGGGRVQPAATRYRGWRRPASACVRADRPAVEPPVGAEVPASVATLRSADEGPARGSAGSCTRVTTRRSYAWLGISALAFCLGRCRCGRGPDRPDRPAWSPRVSRNSPDPSEL